MRKLFWTLLFAGLLFPTTRVNAQAAWDSPLLLPPRPQPGIGVFLADMSGGGLGVIGMWRSSTWNYGIRGGIAEGSGDEDLSIFGGVDFMGLINTASTDFPLDVDWVLGAGAGIGDGVRISVPAGLSVGASIQGEAARFVPYITPQVIFDARIADNDESDLDLGFALDLGLDVRLLSGGGVLAGKSIRFGASLGHRDAIALGIVF